MNKVDIVNNQNGSLSITQCDPFTAIQSVHKCRCTQKSLYRNVVPKLYTNVALNCTQVSY